MGNGTEDRSAGRTVHFLKSQAFPNHWIIRDHPPSLKRYGGTSRRNLRLDIFQTLETRSEIAFHFLNHSYVARNIRTVHRL